MVLKEIPKASFSWKYFLLFYGWFLLYFQFNYTATYPVYGPAGIHFYFNKRFRWILFLLRN